MSTLTIKMKCDDEQLYKIKHFIRTYIVKNCRFEKLGDDHYLMVAETAQQGFADSELADVAARLAYRVILLESRMDDHDTAIDELTSRLTQQYKPHEGKDGQ